MRKEVDYIEECREMWSEFSQADENTLPVEHASLEEFKLYMEMSELEGSQYQCIKNEEKWRMVVDVLFPWISEIAQYQGARIILDIDEDTLIGKMDILADQLVMVNMDDSNDKDLFVCMSKLADDIFVGIEDGLMKLTYTYTLYDEVQVSDKSDEIEKLKKKIDALRMQRGQKPLGKVLKG